MRILITNDDGINGEGLEILANWARRLGEVVIAAPKVEQSGKSHGIDIHEPFEVKKSIKFGDITAYSIDSTPADCVRFMILGLKEKFDLVLSGINKGLNIGCDIVYSGTAGAVFEAAALGVRGIAVSADFYSFETAKARLDDVYDYFVKHDLLAKNDIYNVNIPDNAKEILITKQGKKYYSDDFVPVGNDMYQASGLCVYKNGENFEIDTDAVMHGYISITPLTISRTNLEVYEKLKNSRE